MGNGLCKDGKGSQVLKARRWEGEKVGRRPADKRLCWGVLGPEIKENQGACDGGPRKQGLDVSNMFTLALEELW